LKNCKTLLTALLFSSLLFQGCDKNEQKHPPVIGSAVSITIDDKQATMAPSSQALNELSHTIGAILKKQLAEITQQETYAIFSMDSFNCDISGLKTVERGDSVNIKYEACKTEKHEENGEIELNYKQADSKGQYPQILKLQVKKDYTFNDTTLQKELIIEGTISYHEDKSIKQISLVVTGMVNFNYQTIKLDNYPSTINF